MRHLLLGTLLASAAFWAAPSQAASLSVAYTDLPLDASTFAPHATTSSGSYMEGVSGSDSSHTSPFSDTTTLFDSVGADGKAVFGQSLTGGTLLQAAFANGPASSSFGSGSGTFSFVWGTPDTYNVLSFYNNGTFEGSVTGSGSPGAGNGTGSYLATVSGLGDYNSVVFESVGKNAFEFAAISPVPLPAGLPMFGLGLLGLGGLAFVRQRRGKANAVAN